MAVFHVQVGEAGNGTIHGTAARATVLLKQMRLAFPGVGSLTFVFNGTAVEVRPKDIVSDVVDKYLASSADSAGTAS